MKTPLPALKTKAEIKEWLKEIRYDEYEVRSELVKTQCWPLITKEVVEYLAEFLNGKTVIELAAGTGFLARHIKNLSTCKYTAYDLGYKHYWRRADRFVVGNYGVQRKNAYQVNVKRPDVVVLSWPAYDTSFGYDMIKRMREGQILIYQGEGNGGCTGDDAMHDYLKSHFELMENHCDELDARHAQYGFVNDWWFVYRKVK